MRKIFLFFSLFSILWTYAQQNTPDVAVMNQIRQEGFQHSKVMDIAFHLTDVSGPRLTASPGFNRAAEWAKNTLASWGLKNAQLEPWGEFGKSWQQERCYVAMTKPYYQPLIAIPRAWTGSTPGNNDFVSDLVVIKAKDSVELMEYAGKLKNKIVLLWMGDTLRPTFTPDASRLADSSLMKLENAKATAPALNSQTPAQNRLAFASRFAFQRVQTNFFASEKPALVLSANARGKEGTVFVQQWGSYLKTAPEMPASVALSTDDYLRLQRLAEAGIPVQIEANVKTRYLTNDLNGYNVIAEIPGTDPKLKDEIVMVGGHLDSWQGATGATDNAAGCAVMMEAVRILKSLNIQPKRTIRIALWSGEEQGLLGSRNYIKNHVGDPATMQLKPEQSKISAYYNLDNGTGRIRGVYLQGNETVRPIFASWLQPFADLGASTLTINNTGGTDHLSFDAVGVPGFQFIQDPIEYDTRTHHSNMDTYDHLVPEDLKQAAVIIAAFVYNTAQRPDQLPRKELPKPAQKQRGF
jgi:carboxypeptidase Q